MSLRMQMGAVLRRERLAAGLSQAQLANKAGVTPGYISQVETGYANVTLGKLEELLVALNVNPTINTESSSQDPDLMLVCSLWPSLPRQAKDGIIYMVTGMVRGPRTDG